MEAFRPPILSDEGHEVPLSWPYLLVYNLFCLSLLVLATRLATFLHEFLGHAMTVLAFDGQVNGIRISLFGGGHVYYDLSETSGSFVRFLVSFGGIIINMFTGLFPFLLARRLKERPGWALFFLLFGMVSLLGATAYASLGFYYDQGDPVAWMKGPYPYSRLFWIPFLILSPFLSWYTVKTYAIFHERIIPTRTFQGRIRVTGVTLGLTFLLYFGLYALTDQSSTAIDSPTLAYQRAEHEIRQMKIDARYRELRKSYPNLTEDAARRMARETPILIEPGEVPQKFPLKPVIALLYLLGGLSALGNVEGGARHAPHTFRKRTVTLCVTLAFALLAMLWCTDGWVFKGV